MPVSVLSDVVWCTNMFVNAETFLCGDGLPEYFSFLDKKYPDENGRKVFFYFLCACIIKK